MKAITGNRLQDGRVIYLGADGQWVATLDEAMLFPDDAASDELVKAAHRTEDLADIYLIAANEADKAPAGREALRERIRLGGPTVKSDYRSFNAGEVQT